jgi:hypothetical protein
MLGVMKGMKSALLALALLVAVPAQAQHYDVKTINFDLWCQEQAKLPPDRCDKRLPDDEKQFEAFRDKIEKYEVPYLDQKQKEQQFDQAIMHNNPLDSPVDANNSKPQPAAPAGDAPQ